jgi:SAM-dependent methyltransferase
VNNNIGAKIVGFAHSGMVFNRRTRVLAGHIKDLIPHGSSVLDVGCGDGTIDVLIQQDRPDLRIEGVDVLLRPVSKIPVGLFDGTKLPFQDKTFDVVMFVDVLHHTVDPIVLLTEAARVARQLIILKDHTMDGWFAYSRLRFMDWVGNAHHGVVLPYNYWEEARWRRTFPTLQLGVTEWRARLGLYPQPASWVFETDLHFVAASAVA